MSNRQELENLYKCYEESMQPHLLTEETTLLRKQIIKETDELKEGLSPEQQNKLDHLLELESDRSAEEFVEVFVFAFKLAVRLFSV